MTDFDMVWVGKEVPEEFAGKVYHMEKPAGVFFSSGYKIGISQSGEITCEGLLNTMALAGIKPKELYIHDSEADSLYELAEKLNLI